jgi:hypothetical protein
MVITAGQAAANNARAAQAIASCFYVTDEFRLFVNDPPVPFGLAR